ncbi:MAG TPA: rod-binding protein [Candidatus Acetatifactor stercoripullorum]|uniref:Rod-binding protein n=1 Tax=Candidatus Acetatifactor stercoripullorum TaxID=2838414 RepID=A0A9D1R5P6_9FIRM|nr:rod-binding protein [Candidatus Acetatifactor stercoripullorum]HIW82191.1 rod-binding protein [Candidatus Acetatifactor stercoripullorum]
MDISSITSMYSDIYADASNQTASKLENQLKTDYSQANDEELMDACKQFEAYFLEQMFKEMMDTIPESESTSGSTSSMVDFYKDQMIQNIASESVEQNSLGLAQMLYEQMKRNYDL